MSEIKNHKVPYTTIQKIELHPNADRLAIAYVYGFGVIVPLNQYQPGDKIIYIPIDSIFDDVKLKIKIFPIDAKIKIQHSRVRQIKLRGIYSQGLIINPQDLIEFIDLSNIKLETDLSEKLKISKYEPPIKSSNLNINNKEKTGRKKLAHPDFKSYNGLLNIKWDQNKFTGKEVVIQEKIHGTSARIALLPYRINTLLKKLKKLLGLTPKYEYLYGSNNVDITNSTTYTGFYNEDIYGNCFKKINAFEKLKPNEIVYGEIFGPNIQKNYDYGLKEHKFLLFDVKILNKDGTQTWLSPEECKKYSIERGFQFVPVLYNGEFNIDICEKLMKGPSIYNSIQKVKEGIVIKSKEEYDINGSKQALKMLNPEYLNDTTNTDNH